MATVRVTNPYYEQEFTVGESANRISEDLFKVKVNLHRFIVLSKISQDGGSASRIAINPNNFETIEYWD